MRTDSRAPFVTVIVPVRNGRHDLPGLLAALEAQTLPRDRFEVVLADDGSTDGGPEGIESPLDVRLSPGPRLNAYAARNRAAAIARGEVLAFCDADCRPVPRWLEAGLTALEDADVVAGAIRLVPPERPTLWTLLDLENKDHAVQVRSANAETANLFVRRDVFERVGGFDGSLPVHGDFKLVEDCVAAGARLAFAADALVAHPTRDERRAYLRTFWESHYWYGAREGRAGRTPDATKLRSLVPVVQTLRSRRRFGRSAGLDRRRLEEHGLRPGAGERLRALAALYALQPALASLAQWRGARHGRALLAETRADVLLVASSGGHLLQLLALLPAWEEHSRLWVVDDAPDTRSLMRGEPALFGHGPTCRSVRGLLLNAVLARRVVRAVRPRVLVTTGAALAVPFAWLARLHGVRVVYVESVTRIDTPSLSCRLVAPVADRIYVHWPELRRALPRARCAGAASLG